MKKKSEKEKGTAMSASLGALFLIARAFLKREETGGGRERNLGFSCVLCLGMILHQISDHLPAFIPRRSPESFLG